MFHWLVKNARSAFGRQMMKTSPYATTTPDGEELSWATRWYPKGVSRSTKWTAVSTSLLYDTPGGQSTADTGGRRRKVDAMFRYVIMSENGAIRDVLGANHFAVGWDAMAGKDVAMPGIDYRFRENHGVTKTIWMTPQFVERAQFDVNDDLLCNNGQDLAIWCFVSIRKKNNSRLLTTSPLTLTPTAPIGGPRFAKASKLLR